MTSSIAFHIASFRTLQPPPSLPTQPSSSAWDIMSSFDSVVANCMSMAWALEHSTPSFSEVLFSSLVGADCVMSALGS